MERTTKLQLVADSDSDSLPSLDREYLGSPMDRQATHDTEHTFEITAMSSLQQAMSALMETASLNQNASAEIACSEDEVVRAAIHQLGDLFREFNDSISSTPISAASKHRSVSYKEDENESIDANQFVAFLEDKLSLHGYSTQEVNRLFFELKPESTQKLLTIHYTEFSPMIHQFYSNEFKSRTAEKPLYQREDILQLLQHSIKSKLQSIRNRYRLNTESMRHIHKMEAELLAQQQQAEQLQQTPDELHSNEEMQVLSTDAVVDARQRAQQPDNSDCFLVCWFCF